MKRLPVLACALLLAASLPAALGAKEKEATTTASPSEDSKALASKQLEKKLDELKEALGGMHTAISKGDKASYILYRTQARSALAEIDKIGILALGSEAVSEGKASKQGKMEGTPTPTPEATPTPTPEMTPTPTPTPEATPTPTPSPEATPTPK
jgi:cell division septation protein DedD